MRRIKFRLTCFLTILVFLGCLLPFPSLARGIDTEHAPYWLLARRGGGVGHKRGHFQDKYKRWESLPPEKKRLLRRRLEEWKRLSPEDRALIKKRFEQWKRLPPEERRWLREKLMNWHKLSPEEREFIRQKFLRD